MILQMEMVSALKSLLKKMLFKLRKLFTLCQAHLGISSAIYDYAAIVDADLQHDIKNIEKMYRHAIKNNLDIVISSILAK